MRPAYYFIQRERDNDYSVRAMGIANSKIESTHRTKQAAREECQRRNRDLILEECQARTSET